MENLLSLGIIGAFLTIIINLAKAKWTIEGWQTKILVLGLSIIFGAFYVLFKDTNIYATILTILGASSTAYAFFVKQFSLPHGNPVTTQSLAIGLLSLSVCFNYRLIKYFFSCLILFSLVSVSIPVFAQAPIGVKSPAVTKDNISAMIDEIAIKYDVSPFVMKTIIERESRYNPQAVGDTSYVCPKTGKIAPSWGLVQINTCWHNVTKEQAFDVDFSLRFLAKKLKENKCHLWSTCKNLFEDT